MNSAPRTMPTSATISARFRNDLAIAQCQKPKDRRAQNTFESDTVSAMHKDDFQHGSYRHAGIPEKIAKHDIDVYFAYNK